jgi:signal transduction histidine kinase
VNSGPSAPRGRFLSRAALAGACGGAALAWGLTLVMADDAVALRSVTAGAPIAIGYLIGVVIAFRRGQIADRAYILRLREELRLSQDHIMETATYQALGDYLEIAAHQIKDPLQGIRTGAAAFADDPSLPDAARSAAISLRETTESLFESLRHLASYALTKPGRAPFSVNHLLHETVQLCRHRAEEKRVAFEERYGLIPPVSGPAERVHKALLSVVINAVEAMPFGGGTIVVGTALESDRVVARIRDTGIGIKPEHLPRIYDPFFTTKPESHGVGLGLWAARQTFDLIGADIKVVSAPFQGTEVTLVFPQAAPLRPGREGTEHPPELARNTADTGDRFIA